ncbi:hypothetical protein RvY_10856 [Ramazzottius varieornatus]|uniref:Uncharacterized protein n=1 Tax=Ramazzottius varieornatus TaxID=947166 RepID=A0A1D1VE57_RAMVA|nr:hypothetical protein RvY_10856 [Ramazzottius varieornatus]
MSYGRKTEKSFKPTTFGTISSVTGPSSFGPLPTLPKSTSSPTSRRTTYTSSPSKKCLSTRNCASLSKSPVTARSWRTGFPHWSVRPSIHETHCRKHSRSISCSILDYVYAAFLLQITCWPIAIRWTCQWREMPKTSPTWMIVILLVPKYHLL